MDVVSLFSGCGGTDLGFEDAGCDVVLANDINKWSCETYEQNFGMSPIHADISIVKEFPNAQILVGCYPCQGFSLYGLRRRDDERNLLYRQFGRALKKIKPKFFVSENVKGMLFGYGQKFFTNMRKNFAAKGYDVYWKLLNAKDYGVPQDRERVFIVGTRKDLGINYSFPEPTHGPERKPYITLKDAIYNMPKPKKGECNDGTFSSHYMSRNRKRSWNEVSFTIQANGRHVPMHPSGKKMINIGKDKCVFGKGPNRRLSAKECARIQTFPKSFKFAGPLSSHYEQIGNAVPPKLAHVIAQSLLEL